MPDTLLDASAPGAVSPRPFGQVQRELFAGGAGVAMPLARQPWGITLESKIISNRAE